ncbi:CDP-diacylglycerol diphosphatase [Nonomuraea sp. NPDC004186]
MPENELTDNAESGLSRRRFVHFSGLAGASVVLGRPDPAAAKPPPVPEPPTLPGGPDPAVCGSPTSNDPLWRDMLQCHSTNSCLQNGTDYVVMPGTGQGFENFILVPTQRVNGIECPWICESQAPNYWDAANYFSTRPPTVVTAPVGLGINSQRARMFDQLHIHMGEARGISKGDLEANQARAGKNLTEWADSRVSVRGVNEQGATIPHTYRVLIWPGFSHDNLFDMLRTMLVHALGQGATIIDAQEQMRFQTLIVIPRNAGDYFIVNSELQLRDPSMRNLTGTNTCDPLLHLTS